MSEDFKSVVKKYTVADHRESDRQSQEGGIPMNSGTKSGGNLDAGVDAKNASQTIDVDGLFELIGGAAAGKFSGGDLDIAESITRVKDLMPSNDASSEQGEVDSPDEPSTPLNKQERGIDTVEYESMGPYGLPSYGEHVINRSTGDTLKQRRTGSNIYRKYLIITFCGDSKKSH